MRVAVDAQTRFARELLAGPIMACGCNACKDKAFLKEVLDAPQGNQDDLELQRGRVAKLKGILAACTAPESKPLADIADYLVKKSVWAFGGDGWAYDIGYGGLDHVMAQNDNVNILVMDTEVYSNTGGQASKSTPLGAVAQFAAGGKRTNKKDLAAIAMTYGHVYVARISLANPAQAVKALLEAEAYDGPSIVIAYSHCIAHGINMVEGIERCKEAVNSGHWPLFRYNPGLLAKGENPLAVDSKEPTIAFEDFANNQNRFRVLSRIQPEVYQTLIAQSNKLVKRKFAFLTKLAEVNAEIAAL
jgi:pyruvate-ferredoxin/flavodoxin oxidoreductase